MKASLVTLGNIRQLTILGKYPVYKSLVQGSKNMLKLDEYLHVKLTNGLVMSLPQGYTWYPPKIPFPLRVLCPVKCFGELPYLIFQSLHRHKDSLQVDADFAKKEMFMWAYVMSNAHRSCIKKICIKIWVWLITKDRKKMWDN